MGISIRGILGRVMHGGYAVLTPYRCRGCGGALFDHGNPYLCLGCLQGMQWIGAGACEGCGYPAGEYASHGRECSRCRGGKLGLTGAAAVVRYRGGGKGLVKALKFRGETGLAEVMGGMMAERFRASSFWGKPEWIVPVSLHGSRQRQRGFDQASLLARVVSRLTGVPLREGVLVRLRPTSPQALLRRAERMDNLSGAFGVDGVGFESGKILLVDDVMTTGATMAECARACREAGATRVYGLSFAR